MEYGALQGHREGGALPEKAGMKAVR